VRYYQGQLLATQDLRDDVDYEARMRGLHVRALHDVWGIALGYEIIPAISRKSISVTQGMAYDCSGREIVMSATLPLEVPQAPRASNAQAWWFDLLIRYEDRVEPESGCLVKQTCSEFAPNLARKQLTWRWSYAGDAPAPNLKPSGFADDVRLGEEIPLARVRVTNQGEFAELDLTVRRAARALARPHISGGLVRQGSTTIEGSVWHWTSRIDTTSGGFSSSSPIYFASFLDHPWLSPGSGFALNINALTPDQQRHLLGPFITISAPSRTGFTLDVRMATVNNDIFKLIPAPALRSIGLPVAVNWFGIEPSAGCQPSRESARVYWAGKILDVVLFQSLGLFKP
jgi:hypothetical protein